MGKKDEWHRTMELQFIEEVIPTNEGSAVFRILHQKWVRRVSLGYGETTEEEEWREIDCVIRRPAPTMPMGEFLERLRKP